MALNPNPTNFVKRQRKQKEAYKNRGHVLWTANEILNKGTKTDPLWMKHTIQGTRRGSFQKAHVIKKMAKLAFRAQNNE